MLTIQLVLIHCLGLLMDGALVGNALDLSSMLADICNDETVNIVQTALQVCCAHQFMHCLALVIFHPLLFTFFSCNTTDN